MNQNKVLNQDDYTRLYFSMLERLSVPYYLKGRLEEEYKWKGGIETWGLTPNEKDNYPPLRIEKKINKYNRRIIDFFEILKRQNRLKKDSQPQELAIPRTSNFNFAEIAQEAAIYFPLWSNLRGMESEPL